MRPCHRRQPARQQPPPCAPDCRPELELGRQAIDGDCRHMQPIAVQAKRAAIRCSERARELRPPAQRRRRRQAGRVRAPARLDPVPPAKRPIQGSLPPNSPPPPFGLRVNGDGSRLAVHRGQGVHLTRSHHSDVQAGHHPPHLSTPNASALAELEGWIVWLK